ncbi:hypothetical protein GGD61_008101 [Bradyrhizobium sp. SBR1B]|nr:hypothetical protein [Bradyrhizobium sp. SBR1B]
MGQVIQIDEARIPDHLGEMVMAFPSFIQSSFILEEAVIDEMPQKR